MNATETREKREWWVITDDGDVVQAEGLSCAPDNPDYWWFPRPGFSSAEGRHVFSERGNAIQRAIGELLAKRERIDAQIAKLERSQ